jgi:hypothetical protein
MVRHTHTRKHLISVFDKFYVTNGRSNGGRHLTIESMKSLLIIKDDPGAPLVNAGRVTKDLKCTPMQNGDVIRRRVCCCIMFICI